MFNINNLRLLRLPFSFFLLPVFLIAWSQAGPGSHYSTGLLAFIILHIFIYPASNAYNSYMDQDTGPIGGIRKPPEATKTVFHLSLLFNIIGLILGLFIGHTFALGLILYILASKSYSYTGTRLKRYPFLSFLVVVFFQGPFIYLMTFQALTGLPLIQIMWEQGLIMGAAGLFLAGGYPLSQIYQHEEDKQRGDATLSRLLGYRGTFIFSACSFLFCNVLFYTHFAQKNELAQFWLLQGFLFPAGVCFIHWAYRVWRNTRAADFDHTMRMHICSALCLNTCFLLLIYLKK